ncbi:MAG: protein-L-isoaspartate(D-aspartate) O-methyltransferase [Firmicutes bacterium]|nr:protein-L-isoaspartate(D-aspartate) O-methyltransferase [Bacillota bacterium]
MRLKLNGIRDKRVLAAMEKVPRHEFVSEEHLLAAYEDRPLPIGYGQTISQPYIVALMTELLELKEDDRVLEIGAGSGYQAAILAELVKHVYTVEIIEELAARAEKTLRALGYKNVKFKTGDGYFGWQEESPFNAIIVTAAPEEVPPPLKEQLAEGGRMVIPVGPPQGVQALWKFTKQGKTFAAENHGLVRFVPFTRK